MVNVDNVVDLRREAVDSEAADLRTAAAQGRAQQSDAYNEPQMSAMVERRGRFNKMEAYKVGVVYMLFINLVLFAIAATLLLVKGARASVAILMVTMIIVPSVCSVAMIHTFAYIIDNAINICPCLS